MGVNAGKPIGKNGIILAILLGILFLVNKAGLLNGSSTTETGASPKVEQQAEDYVNSLLTDEKLVYTHHAKERMDCRQISKQEVEDILHNGKVNWRKSKKEASPCATYALEGKTNDGQTVRIVFADCNNVTKVVTAIDLKNNYACE